MEEILFIGKLNSIHDLNMKNRLFKLSSIPFSSFCFWKEVIILSIDFIISSFKFFFEVISSVKKNEM